jgi:hypothetical protein
MGYASMMYRITGNRIHGYAVTIDGLTVSGFATRADALAYVVEMANRNNGDK